jgi:ketosteroid isomerase-like protein
MLTALSRLVPLFVLLAAPHISVAAPTNSASIEAEILRLDAKRVDALVKGDLKALDEIFSDDMVYVHSAGKIDSKKPYLATLASGNLVYVSVRYDPPAKVLVAGRDAAVVTGRANLEIKNKAGQASKRVLTTTTVYARSSAGWKAISYQATPVTP